MKRLIHPLIPPLATFNLPNSINTESYWLILETSIMKNNGQGAYAKEKLK